MSAAQQKLWRADLDDAKKSTAARYDAYRKLIQLCLPKEAREWPEWAQMELYLDGPGKNEDKKSFIEKREAVRHSLDTKIVKEMNLSIKACMARVDHVRCLKVWLGALLTTRT